MSNLLYNVLKFRGGQIPQMPPLVARLHATKRDKLYCLRLHVYNGGFTKQQREDVCSKLCIDQ